METNKLSTESLPLVENRPVVDAFVSQEPDTPEVITLGVSVNVDLLIKAAASAIASAVTGFFAPNNNDKGD